MTPKNKTAHALLDAARRRTLNLAAGLALAALIAACQPTPEELWAKAQADARAGDLPAAVIHLKGLLQQQPRNPEARAALGRVMYELGDAESAERETRKAIEFSGAKTPDLQVTLIEALLTQFEFKEALAELHPPPTHQISDVTTLRLVGQAYEGLGNLVEAEACYRRAMELAPQEVLPIVATATLLQATGRAQEGDALIDRALTLDKDNIPAIVVKGRRMMETGDARSAVAYLQQNLDKATRLVDRVKILTILAEGHLILNDLAAAAESVRRLEVLAPGHPNTRFLRARTQAQARDFASAIPALQRLVNDEPRFIPAERLLGTIQFLNGNLEQAETHLSHAVEMGDSDPYLIRLLTAVRLQQNRPEQAMRTLLPLIRLGPGAAVDEALLMLAGQASLRLGDSAAAISYFRQGSAQSPNDERFRFAEIGTLLMSGELEKARAKLDDLRASSSNPTTVDVLSVATYLADGNIKLAEPLAQRLASQNPGAAWAHGLLASVYLTDNRRSQARGELNAMLKLEPRNKEATLQLAILDYADGDAKTGELRLRNMIVADPNDLRPYFQLADSLAALQQFDEALAVARQATRQAPDSVDPHRVLGRLALIAGRWTEAQDSYSRVVHLAPPDAHAWADLARATVNAGTGESMPESIQKALELAPNDPYVLAAAGDLMVQLRKPGPAAAYFERAYALVPNGQMAIRACHARTSAGLEPACGLLSAWLQKNPRDMEARLFRGLVLLTRGQEKEAIADYEEALAQQPRQPVALNNLASLYFEQGDPRALATAKLAVEVQPASAPATDTLGWIEVHRGDKQRGLALISKAASASPRDPEIQYHLAYAQFENGDVAGARRTLASVLAGPKFSTRDEAESLMRRIDGRPAGG